MGLYYSTDAGVTWHMATIMDGSQVVQTPQPSGGDLGGRAATAVVWNPVRQRFYAAIRYHGYYESADGVTWTRLAHQPGTGLTTTACPTAPGTTGSAACPIFRGALAVQATTGDIFALTVDSNNRRSGSVAGRLCAVRYKLHQYDSHLQQTIAVVATGDRQWQYCDSAGRLQPCAGGGAVRTAVRRRTRLLYAGTLDLYRCSLAAGCVLRNTTNAANGCAAPAQVAPAQHAIAALATAAQPLVYFGNDGGLWRSTDGVNQQATPCSADDATHFQNLNGGLGSLAEVVSFAQHPTDAGTLLVGLGANGTAATAAAPSATSWPQLSTGEGGTVAIDQSNPLLWYVSTAAGVSIRQCSNGAACSAADFSGAPTIGSAQVANDDSLIDAPWLLDPALSSDVLIGTCRVWRGPAASGASWSSSNAISKLLGGPQNASCASTNPVVRSLAAGGPASNAAAAQNAGSEVLYAGMAGALDGGGSFGGHLFSITTANTASSTTAWTDLAASPVTNGQGTRIQPWRLRCFLSCGRSARRDRQDDLRHGDGLCGERHQRGASVSLHRCEARTGPTSAATCRTLPRIALWSIRTTRTRCTLRWTQVCMSPRRLRPVRRPTAGVCMARICRMRRSLNWLRRRRCLLAMAAWVSFVLRPMGAALWQIPLADGDLLQCSLPSA